MVSSHTDSKDLVLIPGYPLYLIHSGKGSWSQVGSIPSPGTKIDISPLWRSGLARLFYTQWVGGSNPSRGTKQYNRWKTQVEALYGEHIS